MTTKFLLPGVATGGDVAVSFNEWGFVEKGLKALYLLDETAGASFADKLGGAAAFPTNDFTSNNAFSNLPGGGVQLEGAQILAGAQFDASAPWTLVTFFSIIDVTIEAAPRTYGLVGLRPFGAAAGAVRGSGLYSTSATRTDGTAYFLGAVANGTGGRVAGVNVNSTFIPVIGQTFMAVHSYDGASTIRNSVYDKAGNLVGTATHPVTDAQLFTISGTTVVQHAPVLGGFNSQFDNGKTRFEALARYERYVDGFNAVEIGKLLSTGKAIAAARGRAWA